MTKSESLVKSQNFIKLLCKLDLNGLCAMMQLDCAAQLVSVFLQRICCARTDPEMRKFIL